MKKINNKLSLATVALAAVFCAGTVQAADEIVIGATLAKTGRYATSARTTETAIDIAVAEINAAGGVNGKQIKLVKFDTNGDPKQAQVAVRSFAEDEGALAVIGPFSSGEARVAFAAGERLGIVQIPNASSAPELADKFKYAFRVTESEFLQFNRLVGTMKAKGMAIADTSILYVSDEFVSKAVGTQLMPAVFGIHKVEIVGEPLGFPTAAFDLAPQVAQLMEKPTDLWRLPALLKRLSSPPKSYVVKVIRVESLAQEFPPTQTWQRKLELMVMARFTPPGSGGIAMTPHDSLLKNSMLKTPNEELKKLDHIMSMHLPTTSSIF